MGGGEENREKYNLSLVLNGFSRDLMNGYSNQTHFLRDKEMKVEEQDEEIELSLGLSMNGRFGVDPTRKKLRRTSSISNLAFPAGAAANGNAHHALGSSRGSHSHLGRTCSLPTDSEEWSHRKVLQSTMSMEARKKRMEKLKNVRGLNCNGLHDVVNVSDNVQVVDNGLLNVVENGCIKPASQGSIGSQGSGSSGISDVQSLQEEGAKQQVEAKSSSSIRYVQDQGTPAINPANAEAKGPASSLKSALLEMPFVSTKENGSNGNKVDGFLYRCKKGEEVRIVCVCHGMFLSPAEFVKHGGGGDVAHPLKHIVINPSPLF